MASLRIKKRRPSKAAVRSCVGRIEDLTVTLITCRFHVIDEAKFSRPLWTSDLRPGREHDATTLREHAQGAAEVITVAFKKPKGGELTDVQKTLNKAHNGVRAIGERRNSLPKTTVKPYETSAFGDPNVIDRL